MDEEKVKELIWEKIENLRNYAILSQQKKQNNNKINIEDINDFDKNSEDHQDHSYAKRYKVIKLWP